MAVPIAAPVTAAPMPMAATAMPMPATGAADPGGFSRTHLHDHADNRDGSGQQPCPHKF
jgi:hypothetical protein